MTLTPFTFSPGAEVRCRNINDCNIRFEKAHLLDGKRQRSVFEDGVKNPLMITLDHCASLYMHSVYHYEVSIFGKRFGK